MAPPMSGESPVALLEPPTRLALASWGRGQALPNPELARGLEFVTLLGLVFVCLFVLARILTLIPQGMVRSRSASDAPISFSPRQRVHQSLFYTQGGTSFLCPVTPPPDPNRCLKGPSSTQGRGPHSPALALGAGEWGGGRGSGGAL